jgi:hypothetical protein
VEQVCEQSRRCATASDRPLPHGGGARSSYRTFPQILHGVNGGAHAFTRCCGKGEHSPDGCAGGGPRGLRVALLLYNILPIGGEHEVIDDQLRSLVEEIGERESAIPPLKLVGLFHALPGHRHSPARQRIASARGFLLGVGQFKARLQHSLCEATRFCIADLLVDMLAVWRLADQGAAISSRLASDLCAAAAGPLRPSRGSYRGIRCRTINCHGRI